MYACSVLRKKQPCSVWECFLHVWTCQSTWTCSMLDKELPCSAWEHFWCVFCHLFVCCWVHVPYFHHVHMFRVEKETTVLCVVAIWHPCCVCMYVFSSLYTCAVLRKQLCRVVSVREQLHACCKRSVWMHVRTPDKLFTGRCACVFCWHVLVSVFVLEGQTGAKVAEHKIHSFF